VAWSPKIYLDAPRSLSLLVVIGSDEHGNKELLAVSDGYRESSASWEDVLMDLTQRGLTTSPKLAIGDGAMGFWNAVGKVWPTIWINNAVGCTR
jgi:transposase-like protein